MLRNVRAFGVVWCFNLPKQGDVLLLNDCIRMQESTLAHASSQFNFVTRIYCRLRRGKFWQIVSRSSHAQQGDAPVWRVPDHRRPDELREAERRRGHLLHSRVGKYVHTVILNVNMYRHNAAMSLRMYKKRAKLLQCSLQRGQMGHFSIT